MKCSANQSSIISRRHDSNTNTSVIHTDHREQSLPGQNSTWLISTSRVQDHLNVVTFLFPRFHQFLLFYHPNISENPDAPEPILRCSVHSGGRLAPGTKLDQTQSRGSDASCDLCLILTEPNKFTFSFLWFSFFWRFYVVQICPFLLEPPGFASGENYNLNNVTKVRKTGHVVDSSQVFIQNSLKQNVNTVKSTFRDGTKKTHKCVYWWGVKYCHRSVEVQGSRADKYKNLAQGSKSTQ